MHESSHPLKILFPNERLYVLSLLEFCDTRYNAALVNNRRD